MPSDTPFGAGPLSGLPDQDALNASLARHWWTIVLRGVIAVLFGIIALMAPGAVMLSLALLFGIYLLVDGTLGLVGAVRAVTAHARWGALLAEAVLNILMGLIALFLPGAAVLAFVLLMAAWALISGGLMLTAAVRLHASHGRWWLGLGGVASLVWGVLLVAAPLMGAVVLTWWLGIYAIVFGIALLACGWRLRGQRPGAQGA
ncbi:MAG: HdeD family acid-resistance protein [Rhodopila sp.]|nr:HdeD family acid-resistance protein [Rhodopila sp.]